MSSEVGNALKNKSKINLEAGKVLLKQNMYCSSIHCYYYSCFQKFKEKLLILYTPEQLSQALKNSKSTSHVFHIEELIRQMLDFFGDKAANKRKITTLHRNMNRLKIMRTESDYKDVEIFMEKGRKAEELALNIHECVREFLQ